MTVFFRTHPGTRAIPDPASFRVAEHVFAVEVSSMTTIWTRTTRFSHTHKVKDKPSA
jgi:hypothetical protein